jgi:uncharacterized FlaG/YvyC family protein
MNSHTIATVSPPDHGRSIASAATTDAFAAQPSQTEVPLSQEQSRPTEMPASRELRVSEEEIQRADAMANKKAEPVYLEFQYQIHDKTNRLMISVINTQTQEVVREIPPEKVLDSLAKMWEMAGVLLDERK